jgi:hypothetical protein
MAFAIFFEPEDAAQIAGSVNAATLPTALKNEARKYWNAGVKNWATAPVGTFPGDELSCPLCRTIVISGSGLTLAGFIALCQQIGAFIGSGTVAGHYLEKLAVEMAQTGVEPWPPA